MRRWISVLFFAWYFLMPIEKQGTVFSGNARDYKEMGPFTTFEICDKARRANETAWGTGWQPLKCYER